MNAILQTDTFKNWLSNLKDMKGKAAILRRIKRARRGNFGDCKSVGGGVCEMRLTAGPGYRVYFTRRGATIYVLLCGGDKGAQRKDVRTAKTLAASLPRKDDEKE